MATPEEKRLREDINELVKELRGITQETLENQRSISNALQDSLGSLQFEKSERSAIRSITKEVNKLAAESRTILKDELGTQKNIAEIQKAQETLRKRKIALEDISKGLSVDQRKELEALGLNLKDQIDSISKINAELEETKKSSAKVADNFGVKTFSAVEDIAKSIPGLRRFSEPFSKAASAAREQAVAGKSASRAFAAGAKSLAKSAAAALPLLILKEVAEAFLRMDKSSGEIAKNLGISYNQAIGLNSEFNSIATNSDNLFITTQNLSESFLAINETLGTNSSINQDLLVTQTELVKQAGYSVEAATQLTTLSLATGQSSKDITTEFLGQVTLLNAQNKLALNEKTLLESISKTSKGTLVTFASQPKELAKAVFEAKKLGLELSQVEKIADGLLDIEQSLTAEFEAEVITGRQLNLERARFFALTNDLAGVSKELAAQDITRASFAKANRIEQDAIAASLGMSRDEMGEMLLEQEALTKLSGIEGATAQDRFNNLVKEVGLEEAKKQIGDETLANQLASVSTQEKFAQSISKLQEIFVSLVDPLLPVLEVFSSVFSVVNSIVKLLDPVLKTVGVIVSAFNIFDGGASFESALSKQARSMEQNWGMKVNDGIAPSSKGPFTIRDSYGATAITARGDSLAVSPNVTREGRNSGTMLDYDKLADAIAKGAEKGTARATVVTNLDGDRVSTRLQPSLAVNTRRYSV